MNIEYVKLSPTGNITILVRTPVPRERQAEIAAKLLAPDCVGGEQVGYIEPAGIPRARARLQMMGGEFCGNAAMALGALLARDAGLAQGGVFSAKLEVSGADAPISCYILAQDDAWQGAVRMPLPEEITQVDLPAGDSVVRAPLVRMPGIAHLIIPAGIGIGEDELRRCLPEWNRRIGADALGALLWNAPSSFINPLVYVPSTGTLVREHGCGSGTAAVGCWLAAAQDKTYEAPIHQPGGTITVRAEISGGKLSGLSITGLVSVVDEGAVRVGD